MDVERALAYGMPAAELDRVIAVLAPLATEARRDKIARVVAGRSREVVTVLENVHDPHNGAAVLRTADAMGWLEVHLIESIAPRFRVNKRVSVGAHKWLDVHHHDDPAGAYAALKSRGYRVYASRVAGDARPIHELPIDEKTALVFGNERDGLSEAAIAAADAAFVVPMAGFVESFNISVAAALSLYDLHLRRRLAGRVPGLPPDEARAVHAVYLVRTFESAPEILSRHGLRTPILPGEVELVADGTPR